MPREVLGQQAYSISEYLEMPDTPQPYLVEGMQYQRGKTVIPDVTVTTDDLRAFIR